MNVTIVVQRHGDHKLYPLDWHDPPPEIIRHYRALAHQLRCGEHLSYRQAQAAMLDR
jgi:hypothetical protein